MDNNIEKKNNKGIVVILIILVLVLGVCFVLSFLGIFNKDTFITTKENKTVNSKTVNEKKEEEVTKTEKSKTTGYYQYLYEEANAWVASEIIFNEDGTVEYKYGGASSSGYFKGTFVEDDNNIAIIVKKVMPTGVECDPNNVQDSCSLNILLEKSGDKLIEKEVQPSHEYKKITKENSRLFNEN